MNFKQRNSFGGWLLLILIGSSITFSTLHSHHHVVWNHADSHVDTGHCLVDNTNICPICGYLFKADTVGPQAQPAPDAITDYIAISSSLLLVDPFTLGPNGRSPPTLI